MFNKEDYDYSCTMVVGKSSNHTLEDKIESLALKIEHMGIACRYIHRDSILDPKLLIFHHKDDARFTNTRIANIKDVVPSNLLNVPLGHIQVYFIPMSKMREESLRYTFDTLNMSNKYYTEPLPVGGTVIMKGMEENEIG